eukprot:TRINITY_DN76616_c0_g1_i1.p1 TRINITY_DN76616_c0_g1~~TRINITY_DN76616_c0_g1_i1.p1  ORF type:complete len:369 (-),score=66.85 TRINITY_DN76616_c0_g1_i1:35-1081(-)
MAARACVLRLRSLHSTCVPRPSCHAWLRHQHRGFAALGAGHGDPLSRRQASNGSSGMLIIDGGLATHIEALGETVDHSLWSARCLIKNPAIIKQAHADYYAAGADVAITASYQAHFDGFRELGVSDDDALAAVRRSVSLAREVAPEGALVAGSVGAYGASRCNGAEYTGDYPGMDEDKLLEWHRPRMEALVAAGCDVLACETVPRLAEARALRRLVEELRCPAWLTFSCRSESEVCSGENLSDCLASVADSQYVIGAGVNCTDPRLISSLVKICREVLPSEKHIVVYPNSGETYCGETRSWSSSGAAADENFVEMAKEWAQLGADCIGGCCQTSPSTIRALRRAFSNE